jgi:hypothetical protein
MMIDLHRDNRDMPSPCVTCADQHCRDERDTPLGGVTVVTLVDVVPMPLFLSAVGTAGGGYAFALCIETERSTNPKIVHQDCTKKGTKKGTKNPYYSRVDPCGFGKTLGLLKCASLKLHFCKRCYFVLIEVHVTEILPCGLLPKVFLSLELQMLHKVLPLDDNLSAILIQDCVSFIVVHEVLIRVKSGSFP